MVLLVIDVQKMIVTDKLYKYEEFINNIKILLSLARKNNIEVIYIRHDDGIEITKGNINYEIYEEFLPMINDKIFDKNVNSAFKDTKLMKYLETKKEKVVMVVGLLTDYCMDATIKSGFEHGLNMIVPANCNTTVDNEYMVAEQSYKYYNEKIWNKRYASCLSLKESMKQLEI